MKEDIWFFACIAWVSVIHWDDLKCWLASRIHGHCSFNIEREQEVLLLLLLRISSTE